MFKVKIGVSLRTGKGTKKWDSRVLVIFYANYFNMWNFSERCTYVQRSVQVIYSNKKLYLYTHIHSSNICNGQKAEITTVSINGWLDKQNTHTYTHTWILFSLKKEGISDTCYTMDEPWGHYAKWNKPDTKRQILCDSTNMKSWEQFKDFIETERRMVVPVSPGQQSKARRTRPKGNLEELAESVEMAQ